ncbi:tetratricopeptide repeat protein [Phenylobacterium montanum]|uniref:Tetratricopeptide repeat protein n=1 Tax=Phenylobacterium montanum TaxID=2823693 RepID=A0A975FZ51_9CAUL|nr:tetratricopeptide repeat protein [Caulobacter sp. S6]QUD87829.1 tetratricopeptide repeat protein [Caulobacter sp. S6]
MIARNLLGLASFAAIALSLSSPVWASGGGGGGMGGMPSMEAPQYDPVVEYQNGIAALKGGDYKAAERDFDHVLDVAPKNADALSMMGLAKSGKGDLKGAQRFYERALKVDPQQILARRELAVTLAKTGQADKANTELATLKARSDACAGSCADAADLKAAIDAVSAALTPSAEATKSPASLLLTDPGAGDRSYVDAVRLINLGRYDQALSALKGAQAVFGPHPDVLTYIGYANRKMGRYDLAETYYRQALSVAPNHRGATEYYGELMVERGDLAGARHMLATLDTICSFGCAEAEDLRRWIDHGVQP